MLHGSARAGQKSCRCIAPGPDIGGSVSGNRVADRTGSQSSGGESWLVRNNTSQRVLQARPRRPAQLTHETHGAPSDDDGIW